MIARSPATWRFVTAAVLFEAGLGLLALLLGWFFDQSPLETVDWGQNPNRHATAAGWGALAAIPMMLGLVVFDRYPAGPLRALKSLVEQYLVPLFQPLNIPQMALLALAAGAGEEMLFRGFLQAGIADWLSTAGGETAGLLIASLVFGACHWLNTTYAVLASLVGLYLGWLFLATGSLLAPIVAHAVYDFLALIYLTRSSSTGEGLGEGN